MSERDYPLSVVRWAHPGAQPTARRVAALVGEPHPDWLEQPNIDQFFRTVVAPAAFEDRETEFRIQRHAALVRFLKAHLQGIRVFRFGRTTIHSYVVGVAPNGDWIGLATVHTET
ncbi:MAG: Nuclease inhibitor-like protein [Aeromicrobium sp.]|nr:Nuclease inhibitor-like protein [Aeromicrobium sp.]